MNIKAADGAALYCELEGNGEPVLLIAGLSGHASFWSQQVARLAHTHAVVTYDQRGAGRSAQSHVRYSVELMADDAIALLDGLGIERAHVVGHSTGGCVAQVMAIEHPQRVRSLVLSSSWTRADDYFRRLFELRRRLLRDSGPEAYVRLSTLFQYSPGWFADNQVELESAEKTAVQTFPPADIVESKIDAILSFDRTSELHLIRAPTLITAAADDVICPAYFSDALAEAIRGSELHIMDHGGHFHPRTRPNVFADHVRRFLRIPANSKRLGLEGLKDV